MKQEDKIIRLKKQLSLDHYNKRKDIYDIIQEAIEFGSQLTAEAAKEKINKAYWHSIEKNEVEFYAIEKDLALQAITKSIIGGDKK